MRLLPFLLLAACAGSFSSSIERSLHLWELDEEQMCTLEEELWDHRERNLSDDEDTCVLSAQYQAFYELYVDPAADYRAVCESSYQDCLAEPDYEPYDGPFECSWSVSDECDFTIEQIEDCENAYVSGARASIDMGCVEPPADWEDPRVLDSTCQAIQDTCGIYY